MRSFQWQGSWAALANLRAIIARMAFKSTSFILTLYRIERHPVRRDQAGYKGIMLLGVMR